MLVQKYKFANFFGAKYVVIIILKQFSLVHLLQKYNLHA